MSCESNNYIRTPPELNPPLPTRPEDINNELHDWLSDEIQSQLKSTDILLITDEDAFCACYSHMEQIQRSYIRKLGMVDFGRFGDESGRNVKVALMRHTRIRLNAQAAVTDAVEVLCPKVALLVGICETMKPKKAKRGDVVISAKLASYIDTKIRQDGTVEYRGSEPGVSRNMGKIIPYAADGWKPPLKYPNSFKVKVHREALMLSGTHSIENREELQDLQNKFPDAVVVEIGGIGLYAAASNLEMEWAVIKGVSDLAGRSEEVPEVWKRFSSAMAASVVHNMFKYPFVLQDWPHYREAEDTKGTCSRNSRNVYMY